MMTTYEHETPQEALARYPGGMALRALHMLIFAILFGFAETLLLLLALLQLGWMVFSKKRNPSLAQFGDQMARWLRDVARFQSGASDDKPFPWKQAGQ
jgi:hypothetical protein